MAGSKILQDYPLLIPYQIDFQISSTGKNINNPKQHDVRWKFGFVNLRSLISGETGASCRGIELDIHLIWSISSGKYFIYLNEIPFYLGVVPSRTMSKLEISFPLPENIFPGKHQISLKSYAVDMPGEAQFDMQFDGQHYSSFYKIFEIGGARMVDYYRATLKNMLDMGILSPNPYGGGGGGTNAQIAPAHYDSSTNLGRSNMPPNQFATSQPQHEMRMEYNRQPTYNSERQTSYQTMPSMGQENEEDLMNFNDEESTISGLTMDTFEGDETNFMYNHLNSRLQDYSTYGNTSRRTQMVI